jgi:hypothetical protein
VQSVAGSTTCSNCPTGLIQSADRTYCVASSTPSAAPTVAPTSAPTVAPTAEAEFPGQPGLVTGVFSGSNLTTGVVSTTTDDFSSAGSVVISLRNGGGSSGGVSVRGMNSDELHGIGGVLPPGLRRIAGFSYNGSVALALASLDFSGMPFVASGKQLFSLGPLRTSVAQDAVVTCGPSTSQNDTATVLNAPVCITSRYLVAVPYDQKLYCQSGMYGCSCQQTKSKRGNDFMAVAWVGIAVMIIGCILRMIAIVLAPAPEGSTTTERTGMMKGGIVADKSQPHNLVINVVHIVGIVLFTAACTFLVPANTIDTYTGASDNHILRGIYTTLYDSSGLWWTATGWIVVIFIALLYWVVASVFTGYRAISKEQSSDAADVWHGELIHTIFTAIWMVPLAGILLQSPTVGVALVTIIPPAMYIVLGLIALPMLLVTAKTENSFFKPNYVLVAYMWITSVIMIGFYLYIGMEVEKLPCGAQFKPRSADW